MIEQFTIPSGTTETPLPGPVFGLRVLQAGIGAALRFNQGELLPIPSLYGVRFAPESRPQLVSLTPGSVKALIVQLMRDPADVFEPAPAASLSTDASGNLLVASPAYDGTADADKSLLVDAAGAPLGTAASPLYAIPPGLAVIATGTDVTTTLNYKALGGPLDVSGYRELLLIGITTLCNGTALTSFFMGYDWLYGAVPTWELQNGADFLTPATTSVVDAMKHVLAATIQPFSPANAGGGTSAQALRRMGGFAGTHVQPKRYVAGGALANFALSWALLGRKG